MFRKRTFWITVLVISGLIVLILFDPASNSFFPKCPFLMFTGWQCPGCGSQRAIHQLLQGEVLHAFQFNPLFVLSLPYLLVLGLLEIGGLKSKFARLHRMLYHYRTINFIFIGIISFWIIRNL